MRITETTVSLRLPYEDIYKIALPNQNRWGQVQFGRKDRRDHSNGTLSNFAGL